MLSYFYHDEILSDFLNVCSANACWKLPIFYFYFLEKGIYSNYIKIFFSFSHLP